MEVTDDVLEWIAKQPVAFDGCVTMSVKQAWLRAICVELLMRRRLDEQTVGVRIGGETELHASVGAE